MSSRRCTAPVRGHGQNLRSIDRCPVHGAAARRAPAPRPLSGPKLANADVSTRFDLAERHDTPPETFRTLSSDQDLTVREEVARNVSTPTDVLAALACDEDEYIRGGVAENPSTPPEALAMLAGDEARVVRQSAACNPSAPPEVLAGVLARVERTTTRAYIADVIATRIAAALGVDASNTEAIEYLRDQEWWTMTPESPAVVLALALSPDA